MKKWTLLSLLLLGFSIAFAQTQTLKLDTKASKLVWTGKSAVGSYAISGDIEAKSGSLLMAENKIESAELTIDTRSMLSSDKQVTKHLKNADFFAVKKYPEASFELTEISNAEDGTNIAKGWLTIKAQRKAFECPIEVRTDKKKQVVKGKATIDRTAYGIIYNSPNHFKNLGDYAIADEFELDFELIFK